VDYPALRRSKLVDTLAGEGLDAIIVGGTANVSYLTGFSGDSSYLILGRDKTLLVSDGRFTQQIAEECPGLPAHIRPTGQTLYQATAEVLSQSRYRAVGFEAAHVTVAELETLRELAPAISGKGVRDAVEQLRVLKDASEVAQIREAIAIAERAFAALRVFLRGSDSEKDLSDNLEYYVRRCGGKSSSFPSIVAVGERSALPHAPASARQVQEGELVLVDWGASGRFYKSDLTRVLVPRTNSPFQSRANALRAGAQLEKVYAAVLQAQEQALRMIRPGVPAQEVDSAARQVISAAGFGERFTHGLGHGIGMEVHEAPALRPNSQTILQAGMVMTVEPGIYVPGWGGVRIEDDVLVTPDGSEVLTSVPKDLQSMICDL
jgi:Xaa-Pro aminopeptidase